MKRIAEGVFAEGDVEVGRVDFKQGEVRITSKSAVRIRNLTVNGTGSVTIDRNCRLRGFDLGMRGTTSLTIGRNVSCGTLLMNANFGDISIGDDVLMSQGIVIRTSDMHSILDAETGHRINPPAPVVIEPHVWLGQEVIVGKGVTIGRDSIVGARSVVSGDIPPGSLAVGIPARVLRSGVTWSRKEIMEE